MPLRARHCAVLAAAVIAACGGDGTSPPDITPATVTLAPPAALTLQSGVTTTLAATVLNRGGKSVTAVVSWSSSDPTVASVSNGVVTGVKVGTATVTATATPASASLAVTVTAGAATQLGMRTQPVGATIGSVLATQPVVEIRDPAGNVVTSSTATVTASIASGGGTLGGATAVAAIGGVATFAGLSITGSAGPRTLTFAAPGLASATSAEFTMAPPPMPLIVLDVSSVALTANRGTSPAPATIRITNGGAAALTGLTVDPVQYDPGQPTGWLTATLSATTAPATLTLTPATATLVEGSYHAVVRINGPGAPNSPASISVTLTIVTGYTVTYGSAAEKVRILDVGGSYLPSVSVTDPQGAPVPGVELTFTSRATSVATVGADGRITARSAGDAWITVSSASTSDSVFVVVPRSTSGPLLRSNVTTWSTRIGDTLFASIFLDTRTTTVGAASLAVEIQLISGSLSFLYSAATGSPAPVVNMSTSGVLRISIGAANGMTGSVGLVNLKLISRTPGTVGWLGLYALDVSAVDGTNITSQATSTRVPFVIQ